MTRSGSGSSSVPWTASLDAATNLIARARQRRWTGAELQHQWNAYGHSDDRPRPFHGAERRPLGRLHESLHTHRKEDFTGLIWRAVDQVRRGTTAFGRGGGRDGDLRELKHIIVDEFQDFSEMFFELLQGVLEGDRPRLTSWQSVTTGRPSTSSPARRSILHRVRAKDSWGTEPDAEHQSQIRCAADRTGQLRHGRLGHASTRYGE